MAWYTSPGGTTCVAAYDAASAASLSASYTNLANPGTYDLTLGTAPTWAHGTGWTFAAASSQYLKTGITHDSAAGTWSAIVRCTATSNPAYALANSANYFTGLTVVPVQGAAFYSASNGGKYRTVNTDLANANHVLCIAGLNLYLDGTSIGAISGGGVSANAEILIAKASTLYMSGTMQAVAIYSGTLSGADVATITTAMLALPAGGLLTHPGMTGGMREMAGGIRG